MDGPLVFIIGIGLWLILSGAYPVLLGYLQKKDMYRLNYQGARIPVSVGWLLPFSQWFAWPGALDSTWFSYWLCQTVVMWGIAYAGWIDDRYGGTEAKGLKGHFRLWIKEGRFSTGMWKVVIASVLAFGVSAFSSGSIMEFILHFGLLVFMTNLLNLLDLRPGRAIKGFFLLFILLFVLTSFQLPIALWLPTVVTSIFLFRDDLKAQSMLGDTGSNSLGMALGCWIVFFASGPVKWSFLLGAILIHAYAEKRSLTVFIRNTPFLHWFDMLGRTESRRNPG